MTDEAATTTGTTGTTGITGATGATATTGTTETTETTSPDGSAAPDHGRHLYLRETLDPETRLTMERLDRLLARRVMQAQSPTPPGAAGDPGITAFSGITATPHSAPPYPSIGGIPGIAAYTAMTTAPRPAPLFPEEVLPDRFGALVHEGASAFDIPSDYIAAPLLALAAAAIGNRVRLELKEGWTELPVIWAVVVGQPGSGKSAGLSLARRPLDLMQRQARDRFEEQQREWREGGETGVPPVMDHLCTSDATIEAVTSMHRHSRGLAVIRDEVAGWAASMDAYRKGGDRQTWLSLWSGGMVKVDRKTAEPVLLDDPAVSVCGGVQPDRLALLLGDSRVRDGFVDRFLFAAPPAGAPGWSDLEVCPWTMDGAIAAFASLRPADREQIVVRFDDQAKARWKTWFAGNTEAQQTVAGFEEGWLAKGPRHLARLALVLHVMGNPRDPSAPLSDDTLRNAIRLFGYFHGHLRSLLPEFELLPDGLEERVWRVLCQAGSQGISRDQLRSALGRSAPSSEVQRALLKLAEAKLAEQLPREGSGRGRPSERWRLTASTVGRLTA